MQSPDAIAVDLLGNVMTCQNTGAKGVHKIGHVADFDAIALDTATRFAFRPECMACPVVELCKGLCMFLEGDFFAQSCANEFAFNMGIMMAAVWYLTGMVVVRPCELAFGRYLVGIPAKRDRRAAVRGRQCVGAGNRRWYLGGAAVRPRHHHLDRTLETDPTLARSIKHRGRCGALGPDR